MAVDYHDDPGNVPGDYDELGLIFLVRTANRRIRGHVHQLPVSQDFTREAGGTGGTGGTGAPVVQLRTSVRPALRLRGLGKPRPLQVCQFRTGVAGIIRALVTAEGVRLAAGGRGTRVEPGQG